MDSQPCGASRFQVVFSRATGSRKQRAKHAGSLSVGYRSAFLYDTDTRKCVMVCKGTGVTPNRIFTKMQAARRGAAWTVGTELTLNGFDVVIEEVMELHLIPYDENVNTVAVAAVTVVTDVADMATSVALKESCSASVTCSHAVSFNYRRLHEPPATAANMPDAPAKSATAAHLSIPTPSLANFAPSVSYVFPQLELPVKADTMATKGDKWNCEAQSEAKAVLSDSAVDHRTRLLQTPPCAAGEMTAKGATSGFKRAPVEEANSAATATERSSRRARRSAASVARELRSSYPHYF